MPPAANQLVRSEAGDASARRILVHRIVAVIDVGTAILAKLDLERHAFASSQPPHILSHEQFGCRNWHARSEPLAGAYAMLCSTRTSSPPSFNVANRKAEDGRKPKRLWRCKFGACRHQRAPDWQRHRWQMLDERRGPAADDVRRFVRISNIGPPRTPR